MNNKMHGSKVINGGCYCTDCGARLEVGSYQSYMHRNHKSGARGACPNTAS